MVVLVKRKGVRMKFRRRLRLHAVDSDSLVELLDELGILDDVQAGRLSCPSCGEKLSLESVGGLYQIEGGFHVFCSSPNCTLASQTMRGSGNSPPGSIPS